MQRALVLNGPNLDLLGIREPHIYGRTTLPQLEEQVREWGTQLGIEVETFQSNHEGDLIDRIHDARTSFDGLVVNAGALTHYSRALQDALTAVELPTVEVHISNIKEREPFRRETLVSPPAIHTIYGRGLPGYRWALRHLLYSSVGQVEKVAYGSFPDQFGDLRTPPTLGGRLVILLHGGLWRHEWTRDTMDGLAVDLARRGYVTWNLEYRRVGTGGGWPESFDDVAAALAAASKLTGIGREHTALLGHSSGGTMALWTGGLAREFAPRLTVAMGALLDVVGVEDESTATAVRALLGRAQPHPAELSPLLRLPSGTEAIVAAATSDEVASPMRTREFAQQAKLAGDPVMAVEVPGNAGSFLDPDQVAWKELAEILARAFPAAD